VSHVSLSAALVAAGAPTPTAARTH